MLINCPGGSIQDGLVLIDVMRAYDGIIKTVSLGIAASMAAVILAAGTKGHRYCSLHSQVMLHQPLISGCIPGGNCSEIEEVARALVSRKNQLNGLLADFTGREQSEIEKLTSCDNYMSAEEALEHGLIDRIADGKELYELIGGNAI
jgi:ATP-dependent Clp protease protease subunit